MTTIKSFTSLEQSKRLAEFLPCGSADMYYPWDIDSKSFLNIPIVKDDSYYVQGSIDCWSLAALLNILHNKTKIYQVLVAGVTKTESIFQIGVLTMNLTMEIIKKHLQIILLMLATK